MDLIDHLHRQFAYDAWANGTVTSAIRANGGGDERVLGLMSHIVGAQRLWLERLEQRPQSLAVWPKADLDWCEAQVGELKGLWRDYLATIPAGDLMRKISYKNTKGEAWENTMEDVLTHVIMHSAYHRGQIASHMRSIGQTPAYTDFIHGVREGLLE